MVKLKGGKIHGSTLIEVLIAMVIIMVIFSLALTIFNNVLAGGLSYKKLDVHYKLIYLSKSVADKGYLEQDELVLDSVSYSFKSKPKPEISVGMEQLEINATRNKQLIGSIKILYRIKIPHE